MTTPGHPDFMEVANRASGEIFPAGLLPLAPGIYRSAVLPVGQWDALDIRLLPTGGQAVVTVNWYEDAAGTLGSGEDTWHVNANSWLFVIYPTQALYAVIQINNTGAVNLVGTAHLQFITASSDVAVYPSRLTPIAETLTLAASTKGIARFGVISKGWCYASLNPHDTAGKLHIRVAQASENDAVSQYGANLGNPTTLLQAQLIIADDNWFIEVTNEDATAPHAIDVNAFNLFAGI